MKKKSNSPLMGFIPRFLGVNVGDHGDHSEFDEFPVVPILTTVISIPE